ncbi:hypothetical protein [Desulfurococcus mucosus]|uniref:Uncharacterized protein n=1 Tax=Desulfurococcus mucosus (strain ATCC 35584 / DSM 2162 / JCM 9187 / O7/1) TaxID=765177 RepID=E8R7X2_DESM0|nr:hypothetical protein [Desulfurococcus mucosus]ADV64598.1 hypothetical protein Desmu_0279 [Desulfurococcus mucosus DSM 2162]
MRAQLPVVIAVTLLVLLMTTTLLYTTSTLTYYSNIQVAEEKQTIWRAIDAQLDTVIVSAVASANKTAYQSFMNKWSSEMQRYNDINQTPTRYSRTCRAITASWPTIYDYTSFVCPGECGLNYSKPGVNASLDRFIQGLNSTLQFYLNAVSSSVYSALQNWGTLMRDAGITVVVYPPSVDYRVGFEGNPSIPYSRFINVLRVNVSVDVFSVEAGYKHFDKYVEYGFNVTFVRGRLLCDSFILPVYIDAYVDVNGRRSLYIPDPSRIQLRVYSKMLERLSTSQTPFITLRNDSGTLYAAGSLYASYYYGNGSTLVIFKIPVNVDACKSLSLAAGLVVNSTAFVYFDGYTIYDDTFPPPYDNPFPPPKNLSCNGYTSVTLAYLFAGLLSLDINGLTVFSGVKIVWKIYWDTQPSGYDWIITLLASVYGDERCVFQYTAPLY